MLIVPELQKVFILVPRTGSGTLYREMKRVYPNSMLLYRHMEADGCPRGYDRWERIGFVRHPLYRLWSLYKFLQNFGGGAMVSHEADAERKRMQVAGRTFENWLLNNEIPFTVPYDLTGAGDFWPVLERSHPSPENKTSQFQYLRPDIGTTVVKFQNLPLYMKDWGLNPDARHNSSVKEPPPKSIAIQNHLLKYCKWDLAKDCQPI